MKRITILLILLSTFSFSKQYPHKVTINLKNNIIKYSTPFNKQAKLIFEMKKHMGEKYKWGATGPTNFDCSGLIVYSGKKVGYSFPRTSIEQSKIGKKIKFNNLKTGDLVFFNTTKNRNNPINHVGIYIGNHKFLHASSSTNKVTITSFKNNFYKKSFKWGVRI